MPILNPQEVPRTGIGPPLLDQWAAENQDAQADFGTPVGQILSGLQSQLPPSLTGGLTFIEPFPGSVMAFDVGEPSLPAVPKISNELLNNAIRALAESRIASAADTTRLQSGYLRRLEGEGLNRAFGANLLSALTGTKPGEETNRVRELISQNRGRLNELQMQSLASAREATGQAALEMAKMQTETDRFNANMEWQRMMKLAAMKDEQSRQVIDTINKVIPEGFDRILNMTKGANPSSQWVRDIITDSFGPQLGESILSVMQTAYDSAQAELARTQAATAASQAQTGLAQENLERMRANRANLLPALYSELRSINARLASFGTISYDNQAAYEGLIAQRRYVWDMILNIGVDGPVPEDLWTTPPPQQTGTENPSQSSGTGQSPAEAVPRATAVYGMFSAWADVPANRNANPAAVARQIKTWMRRAVESGSDPQQILQIAQSKGLLTQEVLLELNKIASPATNGNN